MSSERNESTTVANSFATTHWSVVIAAGNSANPQSASALTTLCQTYWYPIYVLVRRKGVDAHEAQDLTQSFFRDFLERNAVSRADRVVGRFRAFLAASLENFLHNQWRFRSAQKRGGGELPISLDAEKAEQRFSAECGETATPAAAYEREWARTLLDKAIGELQREWEKNERGPLSQEFQSHLWGDATSVPYAELCERFNITPVNLRVTFHRYRQRYRELLRQAIADTVAHESEVEDELRFLMQVVSR